MINISEGKTNEPQVLVKKPVQLTLDENVQVSFKESAFTNFCQKLNFKALLKKHHKSFKFIPVRVN